MDSSDKHRSGYIPNIDRLSVLVATILLTYALAIFVEFPSQEFNWQLLGIGLSIQLTVQSFLALLVTGMTATGVDWLIKDHPNLSGKSTIQHWFLPALSAWVISLPLFQLPVSPLWWIGFSVGGALLILVFTAEYIVVDPEDSRHTPASTILIAISFTLYLVLAVALRSIGIRLFPLILALTFAASLVSLRTLHLRLSDYWAFIESGLIALIIAQLAAILYYWPLTPISFGLLILGPAYALTNLFGNLAEGENIRQAIVEPAVVLLLIWILAIWIR